MRILVQLQLSNYDTNGNFILEADSGWQMVMGRVREMLKHLPDAEIHILGPLLEQLITDPRDVNPDLMSDKRVKYYGTRIIPNALATRFDFHMTDVAQALGLHLDFNPGYDWVYVNDPMQLRNFKALFNVYRKPQPKFAVHSHFIDNPSCPKFPVEASLWLGQVEASIRADVNFWQCQSALDIYKEEVDRICKEDVVQSVMNKSYPWDDGYSQTETTQRVNENKLRFNPMDFFREADGKTFIFIPNRIGGRGRSSDYTNVGKFLFEFLPQIHAKNPDILVIAGNPSQKFSNQELADELGRYGFRSLVPGSLLREEYLWLGRYADIAVGLYDQDSYGGTAARELLDLGALPLWIDNYEYSRLARLVPGYEKFMVKTDFSDVVQKTLDLVKFIRSDDSHHLDFVHKFRTVVRKNCSYEETTPVALRQMGLL